MANASHDPKAREYYTHQLNLPVNSKDQRTALCPFHEDTSSSLSVNLATGLWKCHAGCGEGNRAAFAARLLKGHDAPTAGSAVTVATYRYTNRDGAVVFRKRRLQQTNGKKTFRCEAKSAEGWDHDLKRLNGTTPPLYNLQGITREA